MYPFDKFIKRTIFSQFRKCKKCQSIHDMKNDHKKEEKKHLERKACNVIEVDKTKYAVKHYKDSITFDQS